MKTIRDFGRGSQLSITIVLVGIMLLVGIPALLKVLFTSRPSLMANYPRPTLKQLPASTIPVATQPIPSGDWKTYHYGLFTVKFPPQMEGFRCDQSACWSSSTRMPTGTFLTSILGGQSTVFGGPSWGEVYAYLREENIHYTSKKVDEKFGVFIDTPQEFQPFTMLQGSDSSMRKVGIVIPIGAKGQWLSLFMWRIGGEPLPEDLSLFAQILSNLAI